MPETTLLATAVGRFYDLVLADPDLTPWFEGVDMGRLRRHQAEFLGSALDGGTSRFDLRRAHRGLGIDDAAYDRVCAHLLAAMATVGVGDGYLGELRQAVEGLRDQVVEA
ncbi:group 1 truncated hemoglobin [Klenkia sp. PcliD-1-E]|uniref:group I truncated hemoglobin n=1 Tax=Klenkia sp. PcliD-1-E TaxID=2954492 RepID=UPI00209729D2|nr:group 1 truncated hemoglobin [Klenkia sp. PcliD-1-E]MCO7218887.1 group 1 truncated hemoglobin [Klenkia sp. PcliD-1-E]